jgi:hypothetical protein
VWQQIPAVILGSAADHFEWALKTPQSLHSLLRAAAFASKGASQRLSDQEQRMQGLEQQVAQLKGSMAAVLARLQMPRPGARGQP